MLGELNLVRQARPSIPSPVGGRIDSGLPFNHQPREYLTLLHVGQHMYAQILDGLGWIFYPFRPENCYQLDETSSKKMA